MLLHYLHLTPLQFRKFPAIFLEIIAGSVGLLNGVGDRLHPPRLEPITTVLVRILAVSAITFDESVIGIKPKTHDAVLPALQATQHRGFWV